MHVNCGCMDLYSPLSPPLMCSFIPHRYDSSFRPSRTDTTAHFVHPAQIRQLIPFIPHRYDSSFRIASMNSMGSYLKEAEVGRRAWGGNSDW